MAVRNGKKTTQFTGIRLRAESAFKDAVLQFDSINTVPTTTSGYYTLYVNSSGALVYNDGSSASTLGAAGAVANFTLNDAYDDGRTITVDSGAVTLTVSTASAGMAINKTDAGAQECLTISTASATQPFSVTSTNAGAVGPIIGVHHDSASPADGDAIGEIQFFGDDSAANAQEYVTLQALSADVTSTTEDGTFNVLIDVAGTQRTILSCLEDTVQVGNGNANAFISSNGAFNLVLETNRGTNSGTITITDAANGAIAIAPNGSGVTTVSTGIQVGGTTATACTFATAGTSGASFGITTATITTGDVLQVNHSSAATLAGGNLIAAQVASTDVFTVGETGDTTIAGAAGTNVFTITAGDVVFSDGSLTMTDTDEASVLSITNNTLATSDTVAISSTAQTSGNLISLTGGGASLATGGSIIRANMGAATAGSALEIVTTGVYTGTDGLINISASGAASTGTYIVISADTLTTGDMLSASIDTLTSGGVIVLAANSTGLTTGELIEATHTSGNITGTLNKTGDLNSFDSTRTVTTGTVADNFDMVSLVRTSEINGAGTFSATGAVLRVGNVVTNTSGTVTDTTVGVEINMSANGTGDAIEITHAATGGISIDVSAASTTVSAVDIDGTGAQANNIGLLDAASSGATAAGGSVLRVTQSGEPAAATGYLADFDNASITTTNNPDAVYMAQAGTGRILHLTSSGLSAVTSPGLDLESTNAGAVGAVLRLSHQGGSQAAADVLASIVFNGEDNAAADNIYGQIDCVVSVATAGSERGVINILAGDAGGGVTQALSIDHDGTNAIVQVGDGAATGILQSSGNFDLQIQTGNATTSNITITDGAAGNITLTPNGNGAIDLAGVVLHSETTVSSGAGAVAVTGAIHEITTTAADALTLADGTEGQILKVVMVADNGDGTLTPTNLAGTATTITFADVGDSVTLLFTNAEWYVVGQGGLGTGPVVA